MSLELVFSANGQLPVSKTALYTAPAGKTATVNLSVTNVDSSTRRFVVYVKKSGGTSRVYADHTIGTKHSSHTPKAGPIILQAGDAIEGQCPDGATYIDYIITGTLETLTL